MTDHDRLFKELLSTFFIEFLELFLPQVASTIDPDSLTFLPQEYFADLTTGEDQLIDLLVEVKQAEQSVGFLIHVEAQSYVESDFTRRMFFYFARLYQKYLQRVYPIVVFSFNEPYRAEPHQHTVEFDDLKVLEFNFRPIQLNRLNWRDYLHQSNPIAAALMAKMQIAVADRPRVKAECLRLLVTLKLNPARTRLISAFVDTYLRLNAQEKEVFEAEVGRLEQTQREGVMQIVTSWMEEGIEQGIERGIERGRQQGMEREARSLILLLLNQKFSPLPKSVLNQITALNLEQLEALALVLLQFSTLTDLENWLSQH